MNGEIIEEKTLEPSVVHIIAMGFMLYMAIPLTTTLMPFTRPRSWSVFVEDEKTGSSIV